MAAAAPPSCWAASPALRADAEIAQGGVAGMSRSLQRWLHETPAAAAEQQQQQQPPAVTDLVHHTDVEGCAAAPGRLVRIRGMVQDINANGHFVVGRSGPRGLRLVRDMCGPDGEAPPADSAGGQDAPYEVVFVHVVPTPGETCVFVAASDNPFGPPLPPTASSSSTPSSAAAASDAAAQRRGTKRARDGEEVAQKPFCHAPPPPVPAAAAAVATEAMEVDAAVAASPSPAVAAQQQQQQPAQPRLYSEVDPRRNVVGDGTAAAKLSFVVKVLVPAADESADADSNAHLPSLNAEVEFYGVVQARAAESVEEEPAVDPRAPAMPATAFAMTELPYTQYLRGRGRGAEASAREFVGLCWRNRRAAAAAAAAADAAVATAAVPPALAAPAVGRDELLAFLSSRGFGGDAVAAEVVLLHLLGVHTEIIPVPLGSVPCNISGFGSEAAAARAARALRKVLEKVVVYDVSVPSLNRPDWLPHMDYSVEALATGKLQVTDGTHVVLDETGLAEGKLTNVGVQNLQALKNVALTAQVPYEYSSSYELEMHLKAPLLILSSTASLLKPVLSVKLAAAAAQRSASAVEEEDTADAPEFLAALREYVVKCQNAKSLPFQDGMDVVVASSLQEARKKFGKRVKESAAIVENTIHCWMTLARLHAVSVGASVVSHDHWRHAVALGHRVLERE